MMWYYLNVQFQGQKVYLHWFNCISTVNWQQYVFTEVLQGFQIRNQVKNHHYCSASVFWCIRQLRGNRNGNKMSLHRQLCTHWHENWATLPVRSGWPMLYELASWLFMYTLFNKNRAVWNFVRPAPEVTWRTVTIIIPSRFTFPIFVHLWPFSVFHSLQSIMPRIYQTKTPIQLLNLKLKHELNYINFSRHTASHLCCQGWMRRQGCSYM